MQEPAKWRMSESPIFSLDVRGMSALKRGGRAVQSHESRAAQNRFWALGSGQALQDAVCGGGCENTNHEGGLSCLMIVMIQGKE